MIPPTLAEVGQLMFQGVLQELEHNRDDGCEPPIPEDECFAEIAE